MIKPIINPSSEQQLISFAKRLPQSLLITGPRGVGLSNIAHYISFMNQVRPAVILPEKEDEINTDIGHISIETVRSIQSRTQVKTNDKLITIIDYAEKMTPQAQNSFLKSLEEPNSNIHFILISEHPEGLLPTILSRVEKIDIKPATNQQCLGLLESLNVNDSTKQAQVLFIAQGLPEEINKLCSDDSYFSQRSKIIKDAKEFLNGSTYDKLLLAQKYKEDRAMALKLLHDVLKILQISIQSNPQSDTIGKIDKFLDAYQKIESNGNIRLCLARLVT